MSLPTETNDNASCIDNFSKQLDELKLSALQVQVLLASLKGEIISTKRVYLNTVEAAHYLAISVNTLRAYSSRNILPYYKLGKLSYFLIEDLDNMVLSKNNRVKSVAELHTEALTMATCKPINSKKSK